jgi:ribosomal protein S18 acetylase RimI-like enzyme
MRAEEAPGVSALFSTVLAELPYYNKEAKEAELAKYTADHLRDSVAEDAEAVLLAKLGDQLAGFCFTRQDDGLIWMSWFGVHAGHRHSGIGSALLRALDDRARRFGMHKIWCDSRTDNEPSKRVLSSNGYGQICTIANHWHGQDYVLWQKFVG